MGRSKIFIFLLTLVVTALIALPAGAQAVPSVEVSDQAVLDNTVTIASAYSEGPGFVVIHIQQDGAPGPVAGKRWLNPGWNTNIVVTLDAETIDTITPTLYAMLHTDDNEIGVYEFGTVDGADAPVAVDGNVVTPAFNVDMIHGHDQFVDGDSVTIDRVVAQADGFLVIHAGDAASFGGVLGQTQIEAGVSEDVTIELDANGRTDVLWPMLHVDTGAIGEYEFGVVEGADAPVIVDGVVATLPIWTVPHVRVWDQVVTRGDNNPNGASEAAPTVVGASVLAEVDGFLVIHNEQDGTFGPIAGLIPVEAGYSDGLSVELDPAATTPNLWPMLHVDDGEIGTYEFGIVEGADGPVRVGGEIVTFPVVAAPSLTFGEPDADATAGEDAHVHVEQAVIDAPGWLVIHVDSGTGNPGPVAGQIAILRGVNNHVEVPVDGSMITDTIFPMLHYDTGVIGEYEFGAVEGADLPVSLGGNVVVAPFVLTGEGPAEPSATEEAPAPVAAGSIDSCIIEAIAGNRNINVRSAPNLEGNIVNSLAPGTNITADGRTTGEDGFIWWHLTNGLWVREDVVAGDGACGGLPEM